MSASSSSAQSMAPSTGPMVEPGGLFGARAVSRLEKTTAFLPIVYGSVAFYLGKKADEYQTHQWTLYLRGPNGDEDLSPVISKVVFQLHASFAQPTRELTEPPYEVTERGWGEFEAQIRIIWKDPLEKAIVVSHGIKLYPPGTPANTIPETSAPVIAESYDEVVFTEPTEPFFAQLQRLNVNPLPPVEYSQREHFGKFSDHDLCTALLEAQRFLNGELDGVKQRLLAIDEEMQQVDNALREQVRINKATAAQQQRSLAAAAATAAATSVAAAAAAAAGASGSAASTVRTSSVATTKSNQPAPKKHKPS